MLSRQAAKQQHEIRYPILLQNHMRGFQPTQEQVDYFDLNIRDVQGAYKDFLRNVRGHDLIGYLRLLANSEIGIPVVVKALTQPDTLAAMMDGAGTDWQILRDQWLEFVFRQGDKNAYAKVLYEAFESNQFATYPSVGLSDVLYKMVGMPHDQQLLVLSSKKAVDIFSTSYPDELSRILRNLPESQARTAILKQGPLLDPNRPAFLAKSDAEPTDTSWTVLERITRQMGAWCILPLVANLGEDAKLKVLLANRGYHDKIMANNATAVAKALDTLSVAGKLRFFENTDVVAKVTEGGAGSELLAIIRQLPMDAKAKALETTAYDLGRNGHEDAILKELKSLDAKKLYETLISNKLVYNLSHLAEQRGGELLQIIQQMAPVHQGYVLNKESIKTVMAKEKNIERTTRVIAALPQEMGEKTLSNYWEKITSESLHHGYPRQAAVRGQFERATQKLGGRLPVTSRLALALGLR